MHTSSQAVEKVPGLFRQPEKCRYFCAALRRKSPRFACRNPCTARLPGHLIPLEAGCRPLELPRPNLSGFISTEVFNKLERGGVLCTPPRLCRDRLPQVPQLPLIDRAEPVDPAEVGGPDQIRRLAQLHRPGALQQRGRKLGTEVVVLPGQGVVEVTGHRPQQIVVIPVFLRIHSVDLTAQAVIDRKRNSQFIEAAGDLLSFGLDLQTDLLHHQPRRESEALILPGKAVKRAAGAIQADGGVGVAVVGDQVDQPGKPGPRPSEQDVDRLFLV